MSDDGRKGTTEVSKLREGSYSRRKDMYGVGLPFRILGMLFL